MIKHILKPRVCKYCGKLFTPVHFNQTTCHEPIVIKCKTCGKEIYNYCGGYQKQFCCIACVNKNAVVKEKIKQTNFERYGGYGFNTEKAVENIRKKYGVDNVMQNPTIKNKAAETQKELNGGVFAFNRPDSKLKAIINSHTKEASAKRMKSLVETYKNMSEYEKFISRQSAISKHNMFVKEQILQLFGINFGYEIIIEDCFFDLGYKNIIIDINPSYTHSSNYTHYKNNEYKRIDHHFNRQKLLEEKGYTFIQIFDWMKDCYLDVIEYYLNQHGYINTKCKNVSVIRFDKPQRHLVNSKGMEIEIYDAGIYYYVEKCADKITNIAKIYNQDYSYDVETESDRFDVSGVRSGNCRTRVISNYFDPEHEQVTGRGNFAFCTINLPRLGIEANHNIEKFFELFDHRIDQAIGSLKDRFELIGHKHVYNYPFLMGENVYLTAEKLNYNDEIKEVIKQASISVGFIGLAECLVALIGKHHGESDEAQELGLKIVKHLRQRMDEESEKTGLNWSAFATPAEGLSGRFIKIDKKKYGIIPGVTDRDFYTNSSHVPVYYKTIFAHKIDVEAPYHELCNAGHIGYVEMDGNPNKNLQAYESIVKYAGEKGMTYFSINTQNDRCPVCGYLGIIDEECPRCGFKEGEGVSIEHLKACGCWNEIKKLNGIKE